MIVHDLDVVGVAAPPDEADPPLLVDADAVLAAASTLQRLEAVAGRNAQLLERGGSVKHGELRLSALRDRWRKAFRDVSLEYRGRAPVGEALDHGAA